MITEPQASIFINHNSVGYSIGLAMFEPYGLKGWFCEIEADPSHPYSAIDRVLHLLFVTNAQYLIIGATSKSLFDEIAGNFSMFDYRYDTRIFDPQEQDDLFKKVFALHSLLTPVEHLGLENSPLSAQAFALLAENLNQSDPHIYAVPKLLETTELMELGNNALEQMEMTTSDSRSPSIAKLLVNMITPMGRRLGRFRLFLPIKDPYELTKRYEWIEILNPHTAWFAEQLKLIADVELQWWSFQNRQTTEIDLFLIPLIHIISIQNYCVQHNLKGILPSKTLLEGWDIEFRNHYRERQWLEAQIPLMK